MNEDWLKFLVQIKKRYTLLSEIFDLTQQMADALSREDEVSFSMLLAMRQDPILKMKESDDLISELKKTTDIGIIQRIESLERGDGPITQEETLYKQQFEQNKRLIDKLLPLDSRVLKSLQGKKR